jgi:hypothetical protein
MARGTVVAGKVVVEGDALPEGASVTVLAPEDDETFELGPEEEAALRAAMAEGDRGEVIGADEVLRGLRRD